MFYENSSGPDTHVHFIRTLLFTIVLLIQLGVACKSMYSFLPSSVYDLVGRKGSVSSCWFLISGTFMKKKKFLFCFRDFDETSYA